MTRRIARRPVTSQNKRQVRRLARGRGDVTRTAFLTVAESDWLSGGHLTRSTLIGRGPPRGSSLNSAYVRADTHADTGIGVRKRGEGVLL